MIFKLSRRGHIDPICIGPSILTIILAATMTRIFLSGDVPSNIMLWSLALLVITSQIIHVVHHGMTPFSMPAVAVGIIFSTLLIKTLLGHFIFGNIIFYLLPVLIVLEIIKAAVG